MAATVVSFGEWLPDQPDLGPDKLSEANNVIPYSSYYLPYYGLTTVGTGTLPAPGRGLYAGVLPTGQLRVYAGTADTLYVRDTGGTFVSRSTATFTSLNFDRDWDFIQFNGKIIATQIGTPPMYHTVGAATNFATLGAGTAPNAAVLGRINNFVVLGNVLDTAGTARPATLRWSGIDNEQNWPTPLSATATAQQSGEQDLDETYGHILKVVSGDQFGLVFQQRAITRVTYVGPPVVFQFDVFEKSRGIKYQTSGVQAGPVFNFLAQDGFYATDGVSVTPMGAGKVDKYVLNATQFYSGMVRASYSVGTQSVLWSFGNLGTSVANVLLYMNTESLRWSKADETMQSISLHNTTSHIAQDPFALNSSNVLCIFNATPGTARIVTGDVELNPGGRTYVDGIKPNIESTGTAPAVTVRVGSRADLSTTPSYSATTTPTTRTGFADFHVDNKYHRAEVQIVGNFDKATGITVKAFPTGEA